jgi:hypothetical protein
LIEGSLPTAVSRGAGMALASIQWATAVLYNGLRHVFATLGVSSRNQLASALPAQPD